MNFLSPCPFCASPKAEVRGEPPKKCRTRGYSTKGDWGGYYVQCDQCDCRLGYLNEEPELDLIQGKFATEAEAVAAWNHRPADPLLTMDAIPLERLNEIKAWMKQQGESNPLFKGNPPEWEVSPSPSPQVSPS